MLFKQDDDFYDDDLLDEFIEYLDEEDEEPEEQHKTDFLKSSKIGVQDFLASPAAIPFLFMCVIFTIFVFAIASPTPLPSVITSPQPENQYQGFGIWIGSNTIIAGASANELEFLIYCDDAMSSELFPIKIENFFEPFHLDNLANCSVQYDVKTSRGKPDFEVLNSESPEDTDIIINSISPKNEIEAKISIEGDIFTPNLGFLEDENIYVSVVNAQDEVIMKLHFVVTNGRTDSPYEEKSTL